MAKKNIATVTKQFNGAPDNSRVTRTFKPGQQVEGDLAVVAVANGWAEFGGQKAKGPAPENKAKGPAPENKATDGTFRGNDGGDSGERSKPKRGSGRARKATSGK